MKGKKENSLKEIFDEFGSVGVDFENLGEFDELDEGAPIDGIDLFSIFGNENLNLDDDEMTYQDTDFSGIDVEISKSLGPQQNDSDTPPDFLSHSDKAPDIFFDEDGYSPNAFDEFPGSQNNRDDFWTDTEESIGDDFWADTEESIGDDFDDLSDENDLSGSAFGEFATLDQFTFNESGEAEEAETAPDTAKLGFNVLMVLSLAVLLLSLGVFTYSGFERSAKSERYTLLVNLSSGLVSNIAEVGYQALFAKTGVKDALESLDELRDKINSDIMQFQTNGVFVDTFLQQGSNTWPLLFEIQQVWDKLKINFDTIKEGQLSVSLVTNQTTNMEASVAAMLEKHDEIAAILTEANADPGLSDRLLDQLRLLALRMGRNFNSFLSGTPGWENAVGWLKQDIELFGEINSALQNEDILQTQVSNMEILYERFLTIAEVLDDNLSGYSSIRGSIDEILESSTMLKDRTEKLRQGVIGSGPEIGNIGNVELVSIVFALLSLIGLLWSIKIQFRKITAFSLLNTQASEGSVIKLLDEMGGLARGDLTIQAEVTDELTGAIADSINFAVEEMRGLVTGIKTASVEMNSTTESTESLIASLLNSSDVQSREILDSADEVLEMNKVINDMNESAKKSMERARTSAEVAQRGAVAVRNTERGINAARTQIQETSKQLKRLGESSQQINEIVSLIQDVTEQTNVLSLNASIQAAMAGDAGRGFAVVAEEVQRLAERSAHASNEINELVKNIQVDTNRAIVSMESTTQEVVAGAETADLAGQALGEIESMSQELLGSIEEVADNADRESQVAQTVSTRMKLVQKATAESDLSVSQVAVALEQIRAVSDRLNQSISGFTLPDSS